jgi:quercetin dioxygenase-like cupin family protein
MSKCSKRLAVLFSVVALGLVSILSAAEKAAAPAAKHPAHTAVKPVIWPAADIKWVDAPGEPGVKIAVLWGDPEKGAFGAIHKFPAGFKAPLHTHSADLHCLVISGTIIHGDEKGTETRLPAGSYLFAPHTDKHTTACAEGGECQLFVQGNGKFDIKPVADKK